MGIPSLKILEQRAFVWDAAHFLGKAHGASDLRFRPHASGIVPMKA